MINIPERARASPSGEANSRLIFGLGGRGLRPSDPAI